MIATTAAGQGQNETPPERTTFTFPVQLKGLAALLEEVGIEIIYGANSVPPPVGISEAAKKAGLSLPQLPMPVHDLKKREACRKFTTEDVEAYFALRKERYRIPARVDRVQGYLSAFLSKK